MLTSTAAKRVETTTAGARRGLKAALAAASLLILTFPLGAQERVIIERGTGNVVDVGEPTLRYDHRYFDHLDVPASPIPGGEDVRKYMRDASGAIVLRPRTSA